MQTIQGHVKTDREFIDTLFHRGGTAKGFYKVLKGRIIFQDQQRNPYACIIHNRYNETFFVSCSKHGKGYWYQYALSDLDAKKLQIDGLSYSEKNKLALDIWNAFNKGAK